jgi:polyferredoxin
MPGRGGRERWATTGYNAGMTTIRKKKRKRRKKEPWLPSIGRRKGTRYSTGELILAGLGILVLILVAGMVITSLMAK